jgi:COMPASS component SWD3
VRVWRVADGSLARTLVGHRGGVSDCAWSERSDYLATASDDTSVGLWEVATGRLVRSFRGHTAYVFCVNFNAHSNQLVRPAGHRFCV